MTTLTAAELAAIRSALLWAHANGWRTVRAHQAHVEGPNNHVWEKKPGIEVSFIAGDATDCPQLTVWTDWGHDFARHDCSPESVRQTIDILVAVGVLPAEFSSAYQAGYDALEEQGSKLTREIDLLGGEIERLKAELRRRNHPTVRAVADLVEEMETQFRRAEAAHDAKDEANRRWLEATTSTPTPEQLARRATFAEAIGIAVRGELEAGESE